MRNALKARALERLKGGIVSQYVFITHKSLVALDSNVRAQIVSVCPVHWAAVLVHRL